jgi:hypothetical protein
VSVHTLHDHALDISAVTPSTPQQLHAAALTLAEHATDRDDLALLLDALGITR